MLIVGLDFGYFAATGSLADAFLLRYALTNAADLTYVLGHELLSPNLVIALVPLLVCAGAIWIERRARRRAQPGDAPGLAWLVVPAVLLAGVPGAVSGTAAQLGSSSYANLLVDLFRSPPWEAAAPSDAPDEAPLFDTGGLRFVAGARTRPLNVVVIVLESQRDASRLERGATPFLDRLAKRALVVDELYAVVPPSRRDSPPTCRARACPGCCVPSGTPRPSSRPPPSRSSRRATCWPPWATTRCTAPRASRAAASRGSTTSDTRSAPRSRRCSRGWSGNGERSGPSSRPP
jgi:hypothetical protein